MKTLVISTAFLLALFTGTTDKLTGYWHSHPSPKGNITTVHFKEDKNFETFINNKHFATGKYKLEDNIFSFTDNGCNGIEGKYKLAFYSNDDSLRIEVISDSCVPRSNGMPKLVLGKMKN